MVERRSLAGELSLSCARLAADDRVTTNVGKPSATSQPTRPTQPFILSGSKKMSSKLESDVCYRLQVAPSGESYGRNRRPGRK